MKRVGVMQKDLNTTHDSNFKLATENENLIGFITEYVAEWDSEELKTHTGM